ncbi:MAG: exonuclease domain-containing protein [Akkermansiaceae bacterium]|nr:exonuclease domain-containing protein [Akkermansiaceae bacterium]
MPAIRDCRFTAIDFESAGAARGKTDVPVQIGMARWSVDQGHHDAFVSYLATDQAVQWSARKVHGISDEDLADAPSLLTLWPECKRRLAGSLVVAHGRGTEKRFLRTFPGHGFGPWVDTLPLARALWPELEDHSLGAICDQLELTAAIRKLVSGRNWHDALFDAVASLVLLVHVIELHDLQEQSCDLLLRPDTSDWHRLRRQ